jgi:hypothetical protein
MAQILSRLAQGFNDSGLRIIYKGESYAPTEQEATPQGVAQIFRCSQLLQPITS